MRMLSKIAMISVSAAAFSGAASAEPVSFDHEGFHYEYSIKDTKAGQQIQGVRYPGAVPFKLTVHNGRVNGMSDGKPVSFSVEAAKGAAEKPETVAMR